MPGDHSQISGKQRTLRMVATGSTSAFAQVVGLVVLFALTPLLVRHLGAVQFGIYATIVSVTNWLGFAQLGLGPSVLTELSTQRVLRSSAQGASIVSSAFAVQAVLTGLLLVALAVTAAFVPWATIFNAPSTLAPVVTTAALIAFASFLLQAPFSLGRTVFEAHQRGYVSHVWQIGAHVLRVAAVFLAVSLDGSLALLVLALTLPVLLASIGQYLHAFWGRYLQLRPRLALASWRRGKRLLSLGSDFVVIGIAGQVIMSTDNLVIAQLVGPSAVTPYVVTSTLTQLPTIFLLLALQAAWPAYREAATADVDWLRETHRRFAIAGPGFAILAGVVMLFTGRWFIELWAGPEAVPSLGLLAWLVAVSCVQATLLPWDRLLLGLDRTRLIAAVGASNAAVNLVMSIVLARLFGVIGVAIGTAIGYSAVGWIVLIAARRRLAMLE